ncbi:MAG TPA: efflux RND transporter periplasmic adaptor subunit [Chthoniobacterales bacterium]|jgi:HlyD family secretion protein
MPEISSPTSSIPAKKRRRWVWMAAILLVLVVCFLSFGRKKEKPIEITTEEVGRRDITQVVSATGKIQPALEVKISAEVAGEIIELPVIEGQAVKQGDLIVRIKADVYQAQLEQQQAALDSARADNLQRKAQLLKAEQDLRRQRELFAKKISSETELADAQTNREIAEASFNASTFNIRRAEGQLSQIQNELVKTSIYAPTDGAVSLLTSKLGERVVATAQFAGTEIMRVANLDDMEVRANVNENDVVTVNLDDPVQISIDAYPDRIFSGKVKHVASSATVTAEKTTEEVTNFQVKVQILSPGVALRPGMSATADIQTANVKNVIAVPIQSVTVRTKDDGKSMTEINEKRDAERKKSGSAAVDSARSDRDKLQRVVFLKSGDKAVMRNVVTGLSDNSYIEIKEGLAGGEEIINGTYGAISRDLKDGSKIAIEKPKKDKK